LVRNKAGKPHKGRYVAYYRVSTNKQSLGLDAQKVAVEQHLNGGDWNMEAEFTEKESGRKTDRHRPELRKALDYCLARSCTLIIARLDRLARNVSFLTKIMDSKVNFIACDVPNFDNPATNKMMLTLMMTLAEHEAQRIRDNTKKALAVRKQQIKDDGFFIKTDLLGNQHKVTKLGSPNASIGSQLGTKAIQDKSNQEADRICIEINKIKKLGHTSLREIAKELQARGVRPIRGDMWIGIDADGNSVNKLSSLRNIMIRGGIYGV